MRKLLFVLSLLSAGCSNAGPTAPASIDSQITLAPGEIAPVAEPSMRIRFIDVPSDSRCPANALCVWAGDAAVRIEVSRRRNPGSEHVLHTTLSPRAVEIGDLRIELVQVAPYPFDAAGIPQSDYRVTLRIAR